MSKPVFEDVFAFRGRRDRRSFVYFQLVAVAPAALLVVFAGALGRTGDGAMIAAILLGVCSLVFLWCGLAVLSQRCRDLGLSGWTSLVLLIPVVGQLFALAACFMPGNFGDNRYGPDPLMGGEATAAAEGAPGS